MRTATDQRRDERRIYSTIEDHGPITAPVLAAFLGIELVYVQREIRALVRERQISNLRRSRCRGGWVIRREGT